MKPADYDFDAALLNIAPGKCAKDRALAAELRKAGLWDNLCRASVWQCAAFNGRPMNTETSALHAMLEHFAFNEAGGFDLRRGFEAVAGKPGLAALLRRAGRRHLSQLAWVRWKRWLQIPTEPEDADLSLFADGWVVRCGPIEQDFDAPLELGQPPPESEGEKVAWGFHAPSGAVYPIPF